MRQGVTPVLIPNTMVKTLAADGTMLETAWESRWLPEPMMIMAKAFTYKAGFSSDQSSESFWNLMTEKDSVKFVH